MLNCASGDHKTDAHDPSRDGEVIVHRADRPQYRGLRVLREQGIHSRGVPGRREVERAHEAAGREAGAADVCGHPAAALQRGDSRVQGSDGAGVRLLLRLHGEGRVGCVGLASRTCCRRRRAAPAWCR